MRKLYLLLLPIALLGGELNIECLLESYPEDIVSIENNMVVMKNGARLIYDDGMEKNESELLSHPDIEDMFHYQYPLTFPLQLPQNDPGRVRNIEFFKAMYGTDQKEIEGNLVNIAGHVLHKKIAKKMYELFEILPSKSFPLHGYKWRNIANTNRRSVHSFGIALDLNPKKASYWLWDQQRGVFPNYSSDIDPITVKAFEERGFIWGGKWRHYDTMHFEYRPELLCVAKKAGKH